MKNRNLIDSARRKTAAGVAKSKEGFKQVAEVKPILEGIATAVGKNGSRLSQAQAQKPKSGLDSSLKESTSARAASGGQRKPIDLSEGEGVAAGRLTCQGSSSTGPVAEFRRLKQNSIGKKKTGGRNNMGRITAYHRGGGNKRRYRFIDNLHSETIVLDRTGTLLAAGKIKDAKSKLSLVSSTGKKTQIVSNDKRRITGKNSGFIEITGTVKSIERDPNRTALIALVYWADVNKVNSRPSAATPAYGTTRLLGKADPSEVPSGKGKAVTFGEENALSANDLWSEYSYILAPVGLKLGDSITSIRRVDSLTYNDQNNALTKFTGISASTGGNLIPTVGKVYLLKDLAVGTVVHNLAGKYIRAAGCSGIIISKTELNNSTGDSEVVVSLQSGQSKAFVGNTLASVGSLSNPERKAYKYRKAGQKAWLGRRPIVRGVAMNPIDHPHGGGEGKSSGGRPSVTPWGKPTKGKPTRSKAKPSLSLSSR